MKAQRESGGTIPLNLSISAIRKRSSRFSPGKEHLYPLEQRLAEPTAGLALFLNIKNLLLLPAFYTPIH